MVAIRPTRYPKLVVAATSVLTTLLAGYGVVAYFKGDVAIEKLVVQNSAYQLTVSGAILDYKSSFPCTSGSCSITNPFENNSVSGTTLLACISMNRNPSNASWDLGFSKTPTSVSGTQLMDSQTVGSGATVCKAIGNFASSSLWPRQQSLVAAVSGDLNTVSGTIIFQVIPTPLQK